MVKMISRLKTVLGETKEPNGAVMGVSIRTTKKAVLKMKQTEKQTDLSLSIGPALLHDKRSEILKDMLPDCVESVIAGVKPLLNYIEVDTINAAGSNSIKLRTLIDYVQRRVDGGKYDVFNAFIKILAGAQPQLFESLVERTPTQAEADFCIGKYVEAVKCCIKTQGHSTGWEPDKELDLDVQHINLTLVRDKAIGTANETLPHDYQSHAHEIQSRGENISATELLGSEEEQEKPQKISVHGRAGIGKSTTTQWLARQWATTGWGSSFTMLFLLQLRTLAVCDCQLSIIELLSMFGLFQVQDPGLVCLMASWIKNSMSKVIIFIDGLDEVAGFAKRFNDCTKISDLNQKGHPIELCLNILRGDLLPGCTVISTSRPFSGLGEVKFDSQFEIMGFTEADVEKFVRCRHPSKVEEVMSVLRKSPILMSVCSIAFYCALVSSLLVDGVVFEDADLQTYSRLIAFITVQYVSRKSPDWPFVMEVKSYFPKLARLAHNGIFENGSTEELSKVVFDEYDICRADLTTQDIRSVQDVGLLHTRKVRHGLTHSIIAEFFHLSVQEMLAAAYLLAHPTITDNTFLDLFSGGQFNIALLYLFGLQYDTKSRWINDIRFSIDPSKSFSNPNFSDLNNEPLNGVLDCLSKQCGDVFRNKLQICQLFYEGHLEDKARDFSKYVVPDGKLEMSNIPLTIIDLMAIRFVCKCVEGLRVMYIAYGSITDSLCSFIVSTFLMDHASTLTTLILRHNRINQDGAKAVAGWLKQNQTLLTLNISHNDIGKQGAEALAQVLHHNRFLKKLAVADNRIGDSGAKALASVLHKNNSLQQLYISGNSIGEEGAASLALALHHNCTLTTLLVADNRIGDNGARVFATALKYNNTIHCLNININNIGDEGAIALADALKENSKLLTLDLSGGSISDKGVTALAKALHSNTSLLHLHLYINRIGDRGALSLVEALQQHNRSMQLLDVSRNNIGHTGRAALANVKRKNKAITNLIY